MLSSLKAVLPTVISDLQKTATPELLWNAEAPLMTVFLMTLMKGVSSGSCWGYSKTVDDQFILPDNPLWHPHLPKSLDPLLYSIPRKFWPFSFIGIYTWVVPSNFLIFIFGAQFLATN